MVPGRPTRPIAISGPMGAGKSEVARILSQELGVPRVDVDEEIERASGKSVGEIFQSEGEASFREREAAVLREILDHDDTRVIALGGGTVVDSTSRRALLAKSIVVTLRARPETIVSRLGAEGVHGRPLLSSSSDPTAALRAILRARAEAYREAHAEIDTDGRSPEDVAREVAEVWRREPVVVPLGARTYRVEVGAGVRTLLPAALGSSRVLLVSDDRVWPQVRRLVESALKTPPAAELVLASGELHKTLASVEAIWDAAVGAGLDRHGVILAVGGGVVGDLSGFAASTYLRGVRFVQVPTTLLAAVDASVGGKTGIDRPQGKNLVGTFHQPSAVLVDVDLLETLPVRELRSGLAEVVKTALVGDAALFQLLEERAEAIASDRALLTSVIRAAVAHKARVVSEDERDETGVRAALNFGHTVGHALEAEGGYARYTHGEAVALGMVAALRVGVARGVTPEALLQRTTTLLARLGLPHCLDEAELRRALPWVSQDKKRAGGAIAYVLVSEPGSACSVRVNLDELSAVLAPA